MCFIFHNHKKRYANFFSTSGCISYCNNDDEMMGALGRAHKLEHRRLFIDFPKLRLKVVLLHNENDILSIRISHAVHMKQKCENIKLL
jgi:hypothetical protein